jgi:transcriptional regulator with XRE-family HTH domain
MGLAGAGGVAATVGVELLVPKRLGLRETRKRHVMSLKELAAAAGISAAALSDIERGKAIPRMTTIRKLAEALGVEPQAILWPGDAIALDEADDAPDDPRWQGGAPRRPGGAP